MATAHREANPLLDAALQFAAAGWPVFPCNPATKQPLISGSFNDATLDLALIQRWWGRWPSAMVAVPTGSAICAWVLDIDDPGLFESACEITLPNTRRSSTGKGYHLFFSWDPTRPVRNKQRNRAGWPMPELPGAEVRGEGGYVIVPPSLHPSGKHYTWTHDQEPSEAPDELVKIVTAKAARQAANEDAAPQPAAASSKKDTRYGLAALKQECDALVDAGDGEQEGSLNEAALRVGGLVAGGELTFRTASAQLMAAGLAMRSFDPRNPWTPQAVAAKVDRGLRDGGQQPRSAKDAKKEKQRGASGEISQDGRPMIRLREGYLSEIATSGEQALVSQRAPFYVRAGQIVRPVIDKVSAANGAFVPVARVGDVSPEAMTDWLSRSAVWVKFNARKQEEVRTDPPKQIAQIILSRDGEWTFNPLVAVLTTPTLRPDGSLLTQAGYDPATQIVLLEPPTLPPIADMPSREQAVSALALLDRLLDEFPFVDDASRSVALSALVTPVVRGAISVAPLHAISATAPGSGKSYVVDLVSAIATGERMPVLTAGKTEEETEKRLGAAVLGGQALISIDNVNGELGGDLLCQVVERPVVSLRPLGHSKLVKTASRASCFATGNNIRLVGDMTRRVVLCSLDPCVERPELRTFKSDPFRQVTSDRGKYIAAALTVVRAYAAAGFPDQLPPLASFEDWSRLVRSALVWLGRPDPVSTMERAREEDPVTSSLIAVLTHWHDTVGEAALTTGKIREQAQLTNSMGNPAHGALRDALEAVADDKIKGIDAKRLGRFLGQYAGRVAGGFKLVAGHDSHAKQRVWKVVRA